MKTKRTATQIRRARRRLINRLSPLLQLDLFEERKEVADKALADLKAGITVTTRELDEVSRRAV
jgi:hypothetical protein